MMIQPRFGWWVAVVCFSLVLSANALHSFDVYRAIQFSRNGEQYGSQRTSLNMFAGVEKYRGMFDMSEVSTEMMQSTGDHKKGVVLLLNGDLENVTQPVQDVGNMAAWKSVERQFAEMSPDFPVYFAFDNEDVRSLAGQIRRGSAENLRIVISPGVSKPIETAETKNIQGWLAKKGVVGEDGTTLPSIVITAHHDTFGVVPGLATGSDDNGSGVAALLELARVFSILYSSSGTQSQYNIIFVLTGGGKHNYQGARHWLYNTDQRLLQTVEFALCLDTIGNSDNGEGLFLHVSRPPKKSRTGSSIHDAFQRTAENMEMPFDVVHKKINISDPLIHWEHEQFSRKRILAATLSARKAPSSSPFDHADLLDRGVQKVDIKTLMKRVHFTAEALANYMFGTLEDQDIALFSGSLALREHAVAEWIHLLGSHPRQVPFVKTDAPILRSLETTLHSLTTPVATQVFPIKSSDNVVFYDKDVAQMHIYSSRPFTFELLLSLGIFTYLFGMYLILVGPREGFANVKKGVLHLISQIRNRGEKKKKEKKHHKRN